MPRTESPSSPRPVSRSGEKSVSGAGGGNNRPIHTLRHRSLKAAIWQNQTDKGPMFNVTLTRSFNIESGEWRDSTSFGYDDLMQVAALMHEAHAYISAILAEQAAANRRGGG